jgi:hypothetical protein
MVFSKWGFAFIGFAFIGVLVYQDDQNRKKTVEKRNQQQCTKSI